MSPGIQWKVLWNRAHGWPGWITCCVEKILIIVYVWLDNFSIFLSFILKLLLANTTTANMGFVFNNQEVTATLVNVHLDIQVRKLFSDIISSSIEGLILYIMFTSIKFILAKCSKVLKKFIRILTLKSSQRKLSKWRFWIPLFITTLSEYFRKILRISYEPQFYTQHVVHRNGTLKR